MPRTFQEGETHTVRRDVDKYRPYYYAAVSGDFNPIHLDPEFGQMAGLGGNILHGMCTLAWAAEVAVEYLGESRRLKSIRARFSRPVQIGETLTFTVRAAKRDGDVLDRKSVV